MKEERKPSQQTPIDLLTMPDLTRRINLSESKVYEMAQNGELPFTVIRFGKSTRVSLRAYEQWLHQFDLQSDNEETK